MKKKRGVFFFSLCNFTQRVIYQVPFLLPLIFFLSSYLFLFFLFLFSVSLFFLSDDRYWSRTFIPSQENAPVGIPLRFFMEKRKKKEGGREGRPVGPLISSSLNPTLQSLPSPYSPLENSPCSVNLEKKLEGAETGWIPGGGGQVRKRKSGKKTHIGKVTGGKKTKTI